jgi:peroxiredoxin Q/BCP
MADLLSVGTVAPDFALTTPKGEKVTLASFKGRKNVVLVFYPKDDTPG